MQGTPEEDAEPDPGAALLSDPTRLGLERALAALAAGRGGAELAHTVAKARVALGVDAGSALAELALASEREGRPWSAIAMLEAAATLDAKAASAKRLEALRAALAALRSRRSLASVPPGETGPRLSLVFPPSHATDLAERLRSAMAAAPPPLELLVVADEEVWTEALGAVPAARGAARRLPPSGGRAAAITRALDAARGAAVGFVLPGARLLPGYACVVESALVPGSGICHGDADVESFPSRPERGRERLRRLLGVEEADVRAFRFDPWLELTTAVFPRALALGSGPPEDALGDPGLALLVAEAAALAPPRHLRRVVATTRVASAARAALRGAEASPLDRMVAREVVLRAMRRRWEEGGRGAREAHLGGRPAEALRIHTAAGAWGNDTNASVRERFELALAARDRGAVRRHLGYLFEQGQGRFALERLAAGWPEERASWLLALLGRLLHAFLVRRPWRHPGDRERWEAAVPWLSAVRVRSLAGSRLVRAAAAVLRGRSLAPRPAPRRGPSAGAAAAPGIGLALVFRATETGGLGALLGSIAAQASAPSSLAIAFEPAARDALEAALGAGPLGVTSAVLVELPSGCSDASASVRALAAAAGDFVGLVGAADLVHPDALAELGAALARDPAADVAYTDEDRRGPDADGELPLLKPGWSPRLLEGMDYLGRLTVIRRTLLAEVGAGDPSAGEAFEHDLHLRATERARSVLHVPRVLYRRGAAGRPGSAGHPRGSAETGPVSETVAHAHARRLGLEALVEPGLAPRTLRLRPQRPPQPRVSVLLPTRGTAGLADRVLDALRGSTAYPDLEVILVDHGFGAYAAEPHLRGLRHRVVRYLAPFNHSRMNNMAAAEARGELLLLLNDDVVPLHPDWLAAMVEEAARPGVGLVGAKLLYPDGRVQHAGIVLGDREEAFARHAFRFWDQGSHGYLGLLDVAREVSAVTAACALIPRALYLEVGGLDEGLVDFNDVDLALKVRARGERVVYTPWARLTHLEGASRREPRLGFVHEAEVVRRRWLGALRADPYYHPLLSFREPTYEVDPRLELARMQERRPA